MNFLTESWWSEGPCRLDHANAWFATSRDAPWVVGEQQAMTLGRIERYTIEQRAAGIVITMDQRGETTKGALVIGTVLALSWLVGPYGSFTAPGFRGGPDAFFWVWCGVWSLFLVLALLSRLYRQSWTISTDTIVWTETGPRRRMGQVLRSRVTKWRLVTRPSRRAVFPDVLQLIASDGSPVGEPFGFVRRRSLERFLKVLDLVFHLELEQE